MAEQHSVIIYNKLLAMNKLILQGDVRRLYFDVYFLFIHPITDCPHKGDNR
jgi:hypothetical protein